MKFIFRLLRILFVIVLMSVAAFGVGLLGYQERYRDKRISIELNEKDEEDLETP